jgi:hypothetical protein
MSQESPNKFGASSELVPVRAVIPENRPDQGAIVVMRNGSFRMLIRTGAVNFDMKNVVEQGGLTYSFGALVESLEVDFPIEIVSHSKILDIDAYTRQFQTQLNNDRTPAQVRALIRAHIDYFEEHVKSHKLLQREIFVVLPWKGEVGPMKRSLSDEIPFAGLVKAISSNIEKRVTHHTPTDLEISTARQQLEMRASQVENRLEQMGIWAERLDEDGVRRLLYELYHPGLSERQRDPGLDTGGQLFGGFSAEAMPARRRRINEDQYIEGPQFE